MIDEISEAVVAIPAAGIIGLFVGSFLNVVVYRAPRRLSVVAPRSFCPTCERQLEWWENVPVGSWVLLRGRCRTCHQRISPRYPLVELLTGITFAFVTWGWYGTAPAVGYCGLAATMVAIACIEYGGLRSPFSIAAIGVGASEVAVLVAAGFRDHWRVGLGSIVGLALAVVVYGALLFRDPACTDNRGHGRSALLVAGAWIGGLGTLPIAAGVASSILTYLACLFSERLVHRKADAGARVGRADTTLPPALATPLVTAVCVGLAVSLITAR